jgi:DNA/RNA endonuclease G (NUC1)
MKKLLTIAFVLLGLNAMSQTNVVTNNNLIIKHGDITLYLSDDTSTMVSKHTISYANFKHLGKYPRDNHWFQDTYKGKYLRQAFVHSGYDLGHLTPSSITSYDSLTNHCSFSMFNEAPQLSYFNEHPWEQLEMHVQDSIAKYKSDAIIITGVIYNYNKKEYLPKSRIMIPVMYYKILVLGNKTYSWVGSNVNGTITKTTIDDLNQIFKQNKMNLTIK